VSNGSFLIDNQKISEYYRLSNVSNKVTTISLPKSTDDVIANIKLRKLSSMPGEEAPATPVDEDDPMLKITEETYRVYYWEATQNYTDLASYITALNGIASTMLADWGVTEEKKVLMYTEIETLKQYATDLETNLFGIGSNNYVFPTAIPTPSFTSMPMVMFVPPTNVYIPKVSYLQGQRPL
jgi:hypothetical protein